MSSGVAETGNLPCMFRLLQYLVYQVMIQLHQAVVHCSLVPSQGSFPNLRGKSGFLPSVNGKEGANDLFGYSLVSFPITF